MHTVMTHVGRQGSPHRILPFGHILRGTVYHGSFHEDDIAPIL
jgi:hypothetical protein